MTRLLSSHDKKDLFDNTFKLTSIRFLQGDH